MKKAWIAVLILAALVVAEKGMNWNSNSPIFCTGRQQQRESYEESTMLLQYWGIVMTADELADRCGPGQEIDNRRRGSRAAAAECVMERFLEQNTVPGRPHLSVRIMTGMKLAEIYGKYIRRGIPVMIWSEFEETAVCRMMIGGDSDCYFFSDPDAVQGMIRYSKAEMKAAYEKLGRQAVALIPENNEI